MTPTMITPAEVRSHFIARREIALFDMREEAPFATGHPLFAAQMSVGRLEQEIFDRVPRRDCLVVLYDNGEGHADLAAARLSVLGYTNVRRMAGDLAGWSAEGYEIFIDVNSYSKAFGELVESRRHTPSLSAREVDEMIKSDEPHIILDARRFEEYAVMNIPTSTSVPGAELVMRAPALADAGTTIVVNCAGRTRSIIGTQSLINAGLPNRVVALRNGTIGWTLEGLNLERGADRRAPDVDLDTVAAGRARARSVAYRAGVKHIGEGELNGMLSDAGRTCYRFDVRTIEEYLAGHCDGFRPAPGGQLVQETDFMAPVRGARIVLADDLGSRADMTASWLAQMDWEVYVLDVDAKAMTATGPWRPTLPTLPAIHELSVDELRPLLDGQVLLIDLAPSRAHILGHVPGAYFAIRSLLHEAQLREAATIAFTSPDGVQARLACAEFDGPQDCFALAGGTAAWTEAGMPLEAGLTRALTPVIDVYKRPYEGTDNSAEAMQAYLDWEYGLIGQLERDGTHGFFVV